LLRNLVFTILRVTGCEDKMGYQISIERQTLRAVFDIKGVENAVASRLSGLGLALPSEKNSISKANDITLCWIGKDHWLVLAPVEMETQLQTSLTPDDPALDCRVVLVSDVYAFFGITGPQANDIMAIASPLDTRLKTFPENGATFSELFGIRALILRQPNGFTVAVERSYADMIAAYFSKV